MGGGQKVWRRVTVVDGPLAFRMARLAAARTGAIGLEILTLPLLAARLAGGFCRVADREEISTGVVAALEAGGFADLERVRALPGTVRAVIESLHRAWTSDLNLDALARRGSRLADMALVERRLTASLPPGALLPRQLRDAAIARVRLAPSLFGELSLERVMYVAPVWRPLLIALAQHMPVRWGRPGEADNTWFTGERLSLACVASPTMSGDLCADPHGEVVEALRWARSLLSEGRVQAADVAIAAASPTAWDEHMLVLSREASLPVHFSHGLPALNTSEGQSCAALADLLTNGLSQDRVRRLLRWTSPAFAHALPRDWAMGLPRRAGLFSLEDWRRALSAARLQRQDGDAAERVLLPLLELAAQRTARAIDVGSLVLPPASLGLWKEALRLAPPAAIALSLQSLRVRDDRDPGNSIVWAPATHLVGAPRPYVRLLGLVGRAWPRTDSEDALLPDHIVARRDLIPVSLMEQDREAFGGLTRAPAQQVFLSRSLRSAEGTQQCRSALWPPTVSVTVRSRTRIPEHAFSETDRILARPSEAGQSAHVKASRTCWRNWHAPDITVHDGLTRSNHPAVQRAIARIHSPTSLRTLVRDPLGFLWRYALDMRPVPLTQRPSPSMPWSSANWCTICCGGPWICLSPGLDLSPPARTRSSKRLSKQSKRFGRHGRWFALFRHRIFGPTPSKRVRGAACAR